MADEYQVRTLSSREDDLFEKQWDKMWTRHFKAREVIDIFQDHKDAIKEASQIAAYQLEATFGGANPGTNEFGWMPILPQFLRATSTPTYASWSWNQWLTSDDVTAGWKDWIGTSSSNLKLSKYGTMIVIGFADPVPEPKIGAILAKIKGKDYPIWFFGDQMEETDYHVYELAQPFIIEKEQEFYLQEFVINAGLSKIRPLGVYFCKGDQMRSKTAYAQV